MDRYAIAVKEQMTGRDIEDVWNLLRTVETADGHRPIGEHRWIDLVQGGRNTHAGIIASSPGHDHGPIGYAQISGGSHNWSIDLVVHPHHRTDADSLGEELLASALEEVARHGGGHVHLWVPKPNEDTDRFAHANELARGRDLFQMRRSLPLESHLAAIGSQLNTRPFVPGIDEDAWLDVNNRAFALHPEQGDWDTATLNSRKTEPWFDPAGFLMHEVDGVLAGFCWTKVHADHDPPLGEIYVIAVAPDFQGRGLGKSLTLAGLSWLCDKGLTIGMLYVDSTNESALSLYRSLGFEIDHTDRAYVGDVTPTSV